MKAFELSKMAIVLLCLGGTLLLSPASRAQSEVAPDHFDGTDSWAAAAVAKVPASRVQPHSAPISQVKSNRSEAPKLQPIAAREAVTSNRSSAPASKKRKPAMQTN